MWNRHEYPALAGKAMKPRGWWIEAGIVLLALLLRVAWIEVKPVHFDEGVNGWFVDQMTRSGYYHYDPGNFHGPLHFYALFASLTLFGREVWALRLPAVLASTLCVVAMLAYRRYLPPRACRFAALALAISPGCVFYGRYSIHESWLLLFLLVTVWGLAGLWRGGGRRELWATMLGVTGMILTKETYAIHLAALLLAGPTLWLGEKFTPSGDFAFRARRWTNRDLDRVLVVAVLLIFFFYTGGLLDWSSLSGLALTFAKWGHTGTAGLSGHEKSWTYFFELIGRYEWPALLGLAAVPGLAIKGASQFARYLAVLGLGTLTAYSLIAYKTPWCVIVLVWPFFFVFGLAVHRLLQWLDGWVVGTFTAVVCGYSLAASCLLNFRDFTDENEPYVYVQTLPDIRKLLDPLDAWTARDARNFHAAGHIVTVDHHPLHWLLARFPAVTFRTPQESSAEWDGAFLLVDESVAEEAEQQLTEPYFREPMRLRGSANEREMLYLRARDFAFHFPGREPEFEP